MKSRYVGTIADLDRMDLSDAGDWRETLGGCTDEYYQLAGDKTLLTVVKQQLVSSAGVVLSPRVEPWGCSPGLEPWGKILDRALGVEHSVEPRD